MEMSASARVASCFTRVSNLLLHSLQKLELRLAEHLEQLDVSPHIYAQSWFFSLFTGQVLPLHLSARVWDYFLLVGTEALFRVSLSILLLMGPSLLELDEAPAVLIRLQRPAQAMPKLTAKELLSTAYQLPIDDHDRRQMMVL